VQIAREVRAYRALGPIDGVPRLVGVVDRLAVAIEYIEGEPLGRAGERTKDGAEKLAQLRSILDRIHARGVAHWDLRARDNVLLDREGRVWVLDFASAVRFRPGSLAHRLLFGWCRLIDESAYLKWKRLLDAGPYSPREQRFVDRYRVWRSLWFHRRKAWRGRNKPRS
jgi:predicted Ser/Thr protein kinase